MTTIYNGNMVLFLKDRMMEKNGKMVYVELLPDIWTDTLPNDLHNEGGVKLKKGKKPEKLIGRIIELSTKKNNKDVVLDFFAGSGTTAGCSLKLQRKFINIEMAEYFETLTKKRIKKALWGEQSGISKTSDWLGGGMVNYIRMEQYEDTLNNLEFSELPEKAKEFTFSEQIRYLFNQSAEGSPSLLNINRFTKPFDYEMDIVELNERKLTTIDLVTTFNFLLGIFVKRYMLEKHQDEDYHIILGEKDKQPYAVVWRNFTGKLDLEKERNWIRKQAWHNRETRIFCNADNMFGAESTEKEFLRLMWEGTDHE